MALHGHNFLREGSCSIVAVQHHGLTQALDSRGNVVSMELIGLWISLISLALGIVSAWQQIKSFLLWLLRFSGNAAKSWALKDQALNELYFTQPAALVAYLGKSAVSIFLLLLAIILVRPSTFQSLFGISDWLSKTIYLISPCLIGLILGSITNRCSEVLKLAAQRKHQQPAV